MQTSLFPYYFKEGLFKKVKEYYVINIPNTDTKEKEFLRRRIAGLEGYINSKKLQRKK